MAERRMFAKTIIDSDSFLDMPLSAQALYFHLSMRADDDGFINNPKKIQRMIGASDDDLKILIAKNFIILFETGVIVIKHWKIHNYIRNDRKHETKYLDELSMLQTKENGSYTIMSDTCQPNVGQVPVIVDTEDRLGKDRLGKGRLGNKKTEDALSDTNKKDIEAVFSAWNETTFNPISKLRSGTKRYESLYARIQEYGLEQVLKAICNAEESDYLHSDKANWFNFDWFVRPNNFPKVLERNYNNNSKPKQPEKPKKEEPKVDPNAGLDKCVIVAPDESNWEEYCDDLAAHPRGDGWLVNDDGYWCKE